MAKAIIYTMNPDAARMMKKANDCIEAMLDKWQHEPPKQSENIMFESCLNHVRFLMEFDLEAWKYQQNTPGTELDYSQGFTAVVPKKKKDG